MASPIDLLSKLPVDQTTGLLLILGGATLLIGGIGILTMMLDAVQERRQEIGVRLAVGARRRDVIWQFFLETFLITSLGGWVGVALGVAGALGLAQHAGARPDPGAGAARLDRRRSRSGS